MPPITRPQPAATSGAAVLRVAIAVGLFGILWMAVPRIDAWQRARFAERLADHAEASNGGVAQLAVRRLADTGLDSLAALVRLAGSANADASHAAQGAVLSQLTAWEVEFRATGDSRTCTERLDVLADAIAAHARRFDPAARMWAEQIALRIVAQCDRLPAAKAMGLLATCERLLSAPTAAPRKSVAQVTATAPAPTAETAAPRPKPGATRPSPSPVQISAAPTLPPSEPEVGAGSDLRLIDEPPAVERPNPPAAAPPVTDTVSEGWTAPLEAPLESRPRPLPAPAVDPSLVDVPSPQVMRLMLRRYRQMSDRALSTKLAVAQGYDARAIEQVMRERKLAGVAGRIPSSAAAAPRPAADRPLAERISKLPAAQARTLLRELIADSTEDADTRLQALTLLATSGDPQLAAIARQRALEDADPRIAELATRILRESETK